MTSHEREIAGGNYGGSPSHANRSCTNAASFRRQPWGDGMIETLRTDDLPAAKRITFWNDVVCSTFTSETVDVSTDRFAGRMRRVDLGNVRMAIAESSEAAVTHSRAQASRAADAYFLLHLQLAGNSINQQPGRETALAPGDLTLIDSTRWYRVAFGSPTSILVVRIPRPLLRQYMPHPEAMTMLRLPRSSGANRLAARFIRDLWRTSQQAMTEASGSHLTDALMSVIASAYTATPQTSIQSSGQAAALRIRLTDYIEANLGDSDLNPTAIAQVGRISLRYLHLLFREQGESVWHYVQRRRMEECARVLRDRQRAASSISEIACEHGFNSAAHFCRAFRTRYGVTPGEFRSAPTVAKQPS